MIPLAKPPLVEVLRADTTSLDTAVQSLMEFYSPIDTGKFNYLRAVKTARMAYKGLHRIDLLLAAPPSVAKRVGFKPNQDVIALAAPLAFGRKTQVFDLGKRYFPFGRERYASYRVPFFFVENATVKLYFLQYRKGLVLSKDVYSGLLKVHTEYLLEPEFYGDPVDVEYVDCAAPFEGASRSMQRFTSSDLEMWTDERLKDQLGIVAAAMDQIEKQGLSVKRVRPLKDSELPLFD